jgi:hypothetical protein
MLQNDEQLLKDIQKVGCLFLSLGRMIEIENGANFDPEVYNNVWASSKWAGAIDAENFILNPDLILSLFAEHTDTKKKVLQVGREYNPNKIIFWDWAIKEKMTDIKYKVEKVLTNGPEGQHHRLCDANNKLIYDSYAFAVYGYTKTGVYTLYA